MESIAQNILMYPRNMKYFGNSVVRVLLHSEKSKESRRSEDFLVAYNILKGSSENNKVAAYHIELRLAMT